MADNFLTRIFQPGARGKIWRILIFILILALAGILIDAPGYYNKTVDYISEKTGDAIDLPNMKEIPFRLGLDLLGGTHLVYEADMGAIPQKDQTSALEGVRDVIERRVNVFGVSEPNVQTSESGGEFRVIVELAGVKDVNEAIEMIGETPLLEFKEESGETRDLTEEEKQAMDEINEKARTKAEEVLEKIKAGEDFAELAREYSEDANTKDGGGDLGWISQDEQPQFIDSVKDFNIGDTTKELTLGAQGYEFFKLEDKREKTNPFSDDPEKEVLASHLLLCHNEVEGCGTGLSKDQAYARIKELKTIATPQNFEQLVKENSTEPGADAGGGDLGWFGPGQMVKPFEDAAFEQETGTISYVVETQFGYHLIYKRDERTTTEYKLRVIFIATVSESDILGEQTEWKNTELTGKYLDRATVQFNPNDNSPEVSLEFDSEGAALFEQITERNVNKPVAIYLDGEAISVPTVNEKISGGKAVISGNFNIKEAKLLAQRLNAGALPVPIELIMEQTVGASLGKDSLDSSLKAGLIGLLLVAIFMVLYYRLPGLLAVISLAIYGILILAIFKLWPVTLSLAGLAGFILSVGMAVDANVLIFERLKEELRHDKPLDLAIQNSFNRAWPSIRDGNVSTLITCFILIQFSTSIVKGFAITLGLGILVSMFSAIVITKTLLQLTSGNWLEKRMWLAGVKK